MRNLAKVIARRVLGTADYVALREACERYRECRRVMVSGSTRARRALADGRLLASRRRLAAYRDLHRGKRCFIIGNGPSLNRMDLSLLRNEVTFGMNRIYLLFPKLGFETTYCVTINDLVIEQCAADIEQLRIPTFLSWDSREKIRFSANTIFLDWTTYVGFSEDPRKGVCRGGTVTYAAMQLAYYMGFKEVILIGVDHRFETKGDPHEVVVSAGDDPNHFTPDYFGKGFRWQLPDLEWSEFSYAIARRQFVHAHRQILDATMGGCLEVFPKVDYQSLFSACVTGDRSRA